MGNTRSPWRYDAATRHAFQVANTQSAIVAFVELAEATKAEKPDDAMAAFKKLIGDFLQIERTKQDSYEAG
jgi:hypothetical protein